MKKSVGQTLLGILLGILFAVLFTAVAVAALMSNDLLYRIDVKALDIPAYSGYSEELILRNYKALIAFCSPFYNGEFSLPDLASSPQGAQHFQETKAIFNGVYIAGLIALVIIVLVFILLKKRDKRKLLLSTTITSLAFPIAVILGIAADFNSFFVLFHKVFFNNDYWLFDPKLDPVIQILPSAYFMHCAVVIASFWLLGAVALYFVYRRHKKKAPFASAGNTTPA